jgi:hypothetical protein
LDSSEGKEPLDENARVVPGWPHSLSRPDLLQTDWQKKVLLSHEEDSHDGFAFILEGRHFLSSRLCCEPKSESPVGDAFAETAVAQTRKPASRQRFLARARVTRRFVSLKRAGSSLKPEGRNKRSTKRSVQYAQGARAIERQGRPASKVEHSYSSRLENPMAFADVGAQMAMRPRCWKTMNE